MFGQKKESDKFELLYMLVEIVDGLADEYASEGDEDTVSRMAGIYSWAIKEMINDLEETV